jgi:hypothetical protein
VTAGVQTAIGRFGNLKTGEMRTELRRERYPLSRGAQNDKHVIRNAGRTKNEEKNIRIVSKYKHFILLSYSME